MKKLYFALCAMLISIGTLTATTYNNVQIDGIYYNLDDNYRITVDGQNVYIQRAEVTSNPNKYSGNITILDSVEYDGVKFAVKAIGSRAFQDCSNLTRVVLPESITSIGSGAFYNCGSLLSIQLPEGLTLIKDWAFYNCRSLSSIWISSTVTNIDDCAFRYCYSLQEVHISDLAAWCRVYFSGDESNPLVYARHLYLNGEEVTDLTIPEGITSLRGTFYGCLGLQSVHFPSGFTTIEWSAFRSSGLKSVTIPEGVTMVDNAAFYDCQSLTSVTLPESLTSIIQSAFAGCKKLTSIAIPNSVESIEVNAFQNCTDLSSVTLGANIANLDKDALAGCTGLKSVNWNITNFIDFAAYTLSPFYNLRNQITSFTFGENVQHIPAFMCYEMSNLSRIDIPASVTSVGEGAFAYCGRLTEINAAAGSPLYSSEEGVLFNKNKTALIIYPAGKTATSYIVPNGVQTIEENAFYGCENLASITIPASVTSIGAGNGTIPMWSFEGAVPATITENAFPSDVYIIVDDTDTYKAAWPEYASRIFPRQYAEQTLNLTAQADKSSLHLAVGEANLANVIKLTISGTINSYDLMIMRNKMINLRELDLTNASIEANPYEYYTGICSHADTLIIHSFRGLRSIKLPRTLKYAEQAMIDCPDIKYIEFNGGVLGTQVAPYKGNGDLQVVLNEGVTEIKPYAFAISGAQHAYFGNTETQINTKLRAISLPNSLGKVEAKRFWYCRKLQEVTLGDAITEIEDFAFSECAALTGIMLPANLETIGNFAFQGAKITEITIPTNVKHIGHGVWMGNISSNQLSKYDYEKTELLNDLWMVGCGTSLYFMKNNTMIGCALCTKDGYGFVQAYHYTYSSASLRKLTFAPDSKLKEIGIAAFALCQIDTLIMPDSLATIGQYAFGGNRQLKYVKFGENSSMRTIARGVFQNCDALEEVVLPAELVRIEELAFSCHNNKDELKQIGYPYKLKAIDRAAFYGRMGLENISFPTSLQTIGDYAFQGCAGLDEIKVPSTLLSVGDHAFDNCSNVTKVYTYTVEPVSIDQNTFSCWQNADLYVPSTSYYNYYYNTQWSQFLSLRQFDEEYTYFYINNDYELGGTTGTIDGKPDADLNEESGLIITGDEVQQVGTITLLGDENGAASIIACEDNLSADSLVVRLITKKGSWNYFCFPFDLLLSQLYYPFAYVIREYDGATRAQYGAGGWTDMVGNMLHKGLGYIFQGARTDTIEITIANPHIDCQDYVQEIQAYSAENDIHANWNFIGNPFTSWYDLDVLYESGYSSPVYTWSPSTNDYIAYRPGDDEYHLHPFEGLFTQNPTNGAFSIIWGSNGRETKTQADLKRNDNYGGGGFYARRKARQQRQQEQQRLLINLELSNDDFTARTRVVFNEQARSAYELGIDAAMMDGGKAPLHIWSNQDNNRLAINERPYAGGRVALGYDAREAGFVSLSAARMDKDVILYDNELNQEVDLSQGAYTFYTEAGTNNTRFAIIRIKEKEGEEAALPEVENADETVSVYNLLGQKLIDNVRRGDIQLPTGVYVIENSNGARTEMTIKH